MEKGGKLLYVKDNIDCFTNKPMKAETIVELERTRKQSKQRIHSSHKIHSLHALKKDKGKKRVIEGKK